MQFKISTQELIYLLNKVQNVVPPKASIPLLNNFLLEAKNNELILTATDLTVSVRCVAEVEIIKEGSTTLPAKRLCQLIRELISPTVEFSTNSHHVTNLTSGTSRFKINGMSAEEFPALPDLSDAHGFSMSQKELKEILQSTAFATSKDDNRYVLTGVLMHIVDNKVNFIGTDGKRLAKTYKPLNVDPSYESQSIIPYKAVEEICKNLLDEGSATIAITPEKMGFQIDHTLIITKLLSGDYPDIKRVIPEKSEIVVLLHKDELISLLRQVDLFTSDVYQSTRFTFETGELKLSTNTMELGEGHVSMPMNYQGEKLDIAFNPAFFIDILRHCKQDVVTLGITDSYNPGIILDGDQTGNLLEASPLFVIMPMRLSEV